MSGKRDSNSRPQPWQGCALPTELFPQNVFQERILTPSERSFFIELLTRIELVTSSLPRKCSTTELQQQFFSSRRLRLSPLRLKTEGGTKSLGDRSPVPLALSGAENEARTRDPQLGKLMLYRLSYFRLVAFEKRLPSEGFLCRCLSVGWAKMDSNHRSRRQQIYSLPHLATLVFARFQCTFPTSLPFPLSGFPRRACRLVSTGFPFGREGGFWLLLPPVDSSSRWRDSNPRPADYKSAALAN